MGGARAPTEADLLGYSAPLSLSDPIVRQILASVNSVPTPVCGLFEDCDAENQAGRIG